MKASSRVLVVGVVVLLVSGALSCGRSVLPASGSSVTESEAQTALDGRLAKTQEVRIAIKGLRDALRPVRAFLSDLGKVVDLRVDEDRAGTALAHLLDRLENILIESSNGMIERLDEGKWVLERPWTDCPGSKIRVIGSRIESGEEISIAVSRCGIAPGAFETVLVLRAQANGSKDAVLSATTFENLEPEVVKIDRCTLTIDAQQHVGFTCKPMGIRSGKLRILVDDLGFRNDSTGAYGHLKAVVSHSTRGVVGTANVSLDPGRPIAVALCSEGQACPR